MFMATYLFAAFNATLACFGSVIAISACRAEQCENTAELDKKWARHWDMSPNPSAQNMSDRIDRIMFLRFPDQDVPGLLHNLYGGVHLRAEVSASM